MLHFVAFIFLLTVTFSSKFRPTSRSLISKFSFQILLPELAMLRVCVYDDDKEIIGQRTIPVNAIRPGFRHINLRDKHGTPLPMAMLFVLITVEDWVPDEFEGGCGVRGAYIVHGYCTPLL